MRNLLWLALASCLVITGCGKKEITSTAPGCGSVDDLLFKIDDITEDSGLRSGLVSALQTLPGNVQEQVLSRIKAKIATDGQRMRAKESGSREWVALLLLSTKSETRATPEYRYCTGEFALGNGQSWRWQYSLSDGNQGAVLRILNAQMVNSGVSAPPAPQAEATPVAQPDANAAEVAEAPSEQSPVDPATAGNAPASMNNEEASDAAATGADDATASSTAQDDARLQEQREVAQARAEAERERQQLRQERARLADQQRALVEQRQSQEREAYMRDAAERQRQQQEQLAASQGPTADELYESRRRECPGGFLGSDCRKRIRMEVCEGHWSSSPPSGYQSCKQ